MIIAIWSKHQMLNFPEVSYNLKEKLSKHWKYYEYEKEEKTMQRKNLVSIKYFENFWYSPWNSDGEQISS